MTAEKNGGTNGFTRLFFQMAVVAWALVGLLMLAGWLFGWTR